MFIVRLSACLSINWPTGPWGAWLICELRLVNEGVLYNQYLLAIRYLPYDQCTSRFEGKPY
ncbi:MAG: hypothetical protein RXN91_08855 [Caldivirga sp.]